MKEIRVGLLGGCLAGLGNVKKSELFYSRMKAELVSEARIIFGLEGYSNIDEAKEKVEQLKTRMRIDCLLFQLRPMPYLRACRLILRRPNIQLNPLLFAPNDEASFDILRMPSEAEDEFVATIKLYPYPIKKKYFSGYNINLMLGYMLGVHKAVEKCYMQKIIQLNDCCTALGIKMVVHGPVLRESLGMAQLILRSLTERLAAELPSTIPYTPTIDLKYEGEPVLFEDGNHVNARGHKMLADKLLPAVRNLLARDNTNG